MSAFDSLSHEERAHVLAEHREVRRLMQRYGISEADATALRLGILAGKVPSPEVAERDDPEWPA